MKISYIALLVSALASFASALSAQQKGISPIGTLTSEDWTRLMTTLVSNRVLIMQEGSRFNWCRLSEVFDSSGNLIGSEEIRLKATVTNRKDCPALSDQDRLPRHGVVVDFRSIKVFPDSIIVTAEGKRPSAKLLEQYVVRRAFGRLSVFVYRVIGIQEEG